MKFSRSIASIINSEYFDLKSFFQDGLEPPVYKMSDFANPVRQFLKATNMYENQFFEC